MPLSPEDMDETLRMLAEQRGLARVWTLFPEQVRTAAERGGRLLTPLPESDEPVEPAFGFDPARTAESQ